MIKQFIISNEIQKRIIQLKRIGIEIDSSKIIKLNPRIIIPNIYVYKENIYN